MASAAESSDGAERPRAREGRFATVAELIRYTVDRMPPLTPEQRADLAALLRGGDPDDA